MHKRQHRAVWPMEEQRLPVKQILFLVIFIKKREYINLSYLSGDWRLLPGNWNMKNS